MQAETLVVFEVHRWPRRAAWAVAVTCLLVSLWPFGATVAITCRRPAGDAEAKCDETRGVVFAERREFTLAGSRIGTALPGPDPEAHQASEGYIVVYEPAGLPRRSILVSRSEYLAWREFGDGRILHAEASGAPDDAILSLRVRVVFLLLAASFFLTVPNVRRPRVIACTLDREEGRLSIRTTEKRSTTTCEIVFTGSVREVRFLAEVADRSSTLVAHDDGGAHVLVSDLDGWAGPRAADRLSTLLVRGRPVT